MSLSLPDGPHVDIDGAARDRSVLVEVFAHQGRLRGAQFDKVARDALKLITIARQHPDARLMLAFGDEAASACVTGKSWLAEALRTWGVEVMVVSLEEEVRAGLVAAQARQVMTNPTSDEAVSEAQGHRRWGVVDHHQGGRAGAASSEPAQRGKVAQAGAKNSRASSAERRSS